MVRRCRRDAHLERLCRAKGDVRSTPTFVDTMRFSAQGLSDAYVASLVTSAILTEQGHTGADLRCEATTRFVSMLPLLGRRRAVIPLPSAAAIAGRASEVISPRLPGPRRQRLGRSNVLRRFALRLARRLDGMAVVRFWRRPSGPFDDPVDGL